MLPKGMNEHAIYDTVGAKRQRSVFIVVVFGQAADSLVVADLL
jgi:hypothetical protein